MLHDKIRDTRITLGLSQTELARISGHPISTIHAIEKGNNHNPGFKIIGDIAHVLKIPLDVLYKEIKIKDFPE